MADRPQNPAAEAGMKAVQDAVGGAVAAQQRSMGLAQNWTETVIGTYREQAESYRVLTDAITSSLEALQKTLESQEETNRALKKSLDAYRSLIENVTQTQEQNVQLAQNYFDDVIETLRSQLEGSRQLLLEPAARQQEFFQNITQEWLDAYLRLMNSPMELYRAGDEGATGSGSGGEES